MPNTNSENPTSPGAPLVAPVPGPPQVTGGAAPDTKGLLLGADIAKQLITLSIAIVTITMTFAEKLGTRSGELIHIPSVLQVAWGLLSLSLFFSIWTLFSITGTLNELDKGEPETNPARSNINIPAGLMAITFLIGSICVFVTGFRLVGSHGLSSAPSAPPLPLPAQVILAGISPNVALPVTLVTVDSTGKPVPVATPILDKTKAVPVDLTLLCGSHNPLSVRIVK
jgi:hypothetical protein